MTADLVPAKDVWVLIGAYNEEPMIAHVVADVTSYGYHVVVVDDGSTDATAAVAQEAGAVVLQHPLNLGQGAALQTAFDFALMGGAAFLVSFDADGQHRGRDVAGLIEGLVDGNADFALGSRFLGGSVNMPGSRKLLLKAATLFSRLTTGLSITDSHNGLRALSRRGALAIGLKQNRMAHASEFLQQVAKSGFPYVEVPVTIEYSKYSLAKGQKLSNALRIAFDLFARKLQK